MRVFAGQRALQRGHASHVRRLFASGDFTKHLSIETQLAHAGCDVQGVGTDEQHGGVTPPIHMASTYERSPELDYPKGFVYGRTSNPTRSLLEATLARIEGGQEAAAFSSGMAAVSAIFQASPKAMVLLPDDVYHGTRTVLDTVFRGWLSYRTVDYTDLAAVSAAALQASASGCHPRIITWAETPSNPLLKVTDVTAVAAAVREAVSSSSSEAVVVVDSTWLTPALMRPLVECGADLVVHSSTKYLAGHSDLVGGAVVVRSSEQQQEEEEKEDGGGGRNGGGNSGDGGSDDSGDSVGDGAGTGAGASAARAVFEGVRQVQCVAGSQQAPFDCWLLLRGMRSLGARLRVHGSNALAVAEFLEDHPAVAAVHYPGLPDHPGHATMADQCHGSDVYGFGGMLSFQPKGGLSAAVAVAANLKVFRRATSLGGTESLVEHRRSIEPPEFSATPDDLLRLSVGLEHETDLIRDLDFALAAVGKPR